MFEDLEKSIDEKQDFIQEKEIIQKQENIKEEVPIKKKKFDNLKEAYNNKLKKFERNINYQEKDRSFFRKDKKNIKNFSLAKISIIIFVVLLLGTGFLFYYAKGEAMLLSHQMKWDWENQTENYYLENSLFLELKNINLSKDNDEVNSFFPIPKSVKLIYNLYSTIIGNNSDNLFELKLDIGPELDLNLNLKNIDNNLYIKPRIIGLKDVFPFFQLPDIDSKDEWIFAEIDSEKLSSIGLSNFEDFLYKNNHRDKILDELEEKIISFLNIIKKGRVFSIKDPHEIRDLEGIKLKKINYSLEKSKIDEFVFLWIDTFAEDENKIQEARESFVKFKIDELEKWEEMGNFISNLKISLWIDTDTKVIKGVDLELKDFFINIGEYSADLNLELSFASEDVEIENILSPESFIPIEEFLQSIGDYSNENQSFLNNEAQTMEISSNQDSYNDEEDNKKDSDRDGIPDCIEEHIGTDLNNQDTDGDGYLDLEEIKNGYNPLGEGKADYDFLELLYTSDIYNKK